MAGSYTGPGNGKLAERRDSGGVRLAGESRARVCSRFEPGLAEGPVSAGGSHGRRCGTERREPFAPVLDAAVILYPRGKSLAPGRAT